MPADIEQADRPCSGLMVRRARSWVLHESFGIFRKQLRRGRHVFCDIEQLANESL